VALEQTEAARGIAVARTIRCLGAVGGGSGVPSARGRICRPCASHAMPLGNANTYASGASSGTRSACSRALAPLETEVASIAPKQAARAMWGTLVCANFECAGERGGLEGVGQDTDHCHVPSVYFCTLSVDRQSPHHARLTGCIWRGPHCAMSPRALDMSRVQKYSRDVGGCRVSWRSPSNVPGGLTASGATRRAGTASALRRQPKRPTPIT